MGALKSRLILSIYKDDAYASLDPDRIAVRVRDADTRGQDPYQVPLSSLSRQELRRAAGTHLGLRMEHGATIEELRSAIRGRVNLPGYVPVDWAPRSRAERAETPDPIETPRPMPDDVNPIDKDTRDAATIQHEEADSTDTADKLAALLASLAPRVDVEALRATITADVTAAFETRLREAENVPVRVTVNFPTHAQDLPTLHHKDLPEVISVLAAGVAVFLSGPAGTGKSTIIEQATHAMGKSFHPQSCDPSMMRSALFGFADAHGNYHPTPFRNAYEDGGVFLLDEIDNGHPSILAGLNQALANGHCAFPDALVTRHPDFTFAATANTWGLGATAEYVGRNPVDAATLDRFPAKFYVDYDPKMERGAALAYASDETHATISEWIDNVQRIRRNVVAEKVRLLITPRATIAGARMIAAGMTPERVQDLTIFAGVASDVRERVTQ